MSELLMGIVGTAAYGLVGTLLMGLGFLLVDIVTPGKLREQIWTQGNRNAAIVLASGLLGVGFIVVAAILTSDDNLGKGLISTVAYGIVGLVVMAVAFGLLDLLTPGKLGEILVRPEPQAAVWVTASMQLAIGGIIAASVT